MVFRDHDTHAALLCWAVNNPTKKNHLLQCASFGTLGPEGEKRPRTPDPPGSAVRPSDGTPGAGSTLGGPWGGGGGSKPSTIC